MSGKLLHEPWAVCLVAVTAAAATLLGGAGCRDRARREPTRPAAAVESAIRPERFAPAFRKLGRAHFRSVARLEAGVDGAAMEQVTTETDIWMDDQGNWRLVELNDKDGGREIVLHGRELTVALRYGKMIRRAAEDPEPQRLLEEGIGGPFAAWDLLRDVSTVDDFGEENRGGRKVHLYKLTKAARPAPDPAAELDAADRQSWRRTLVAETVEGTVAIDAATGLPLQADIRARYSMRRPARQSGASAATGAGAGEVGTAMHGAVDVRASMEDIGQSPAIARPEAEDLAVRQRTVPDEKALLGGLAQSAPPGRGESRGTDKSTGNKPAAGNAGSTGAAGATGAKAESRR